MNIKIERNLVIDGAKNLILECDLSYQCLESITLKNCRNIMMSRIPYLKKLSIEYCNDITITGSNIDNIDIIGTVKYSFAFNIIKSLHVDKMSTGIIESNKVKD